MERVVDYAGLGAAQFDEELRVAGVVRMWREVPRRLRQRQRGDVGGMTAGPR